jgi:uncharacterized protein (DUF1501 family)
MRDIALPNVSATGGGTGRRDVTIRQIVTNGNLGTDHGRGISSVLVGSDVTGGVYGTLFPVSEAVESNGKIPLETHGADIFGETSRAKTIFNHVLTRLQASGSRLCRNGEFQLIQII